MLSLSVDETTSLSLLRAASQNRWIKTLSISNINASAATTVSQILPCLTEIEKLYLSTRELPQDPYRAPLGVLLQASSHLKCLHLWGNITNERMIGILVTTLMRKPSLEELDISAFSLDSEVHLKTLQDYLSSTTELKVLSLTMRNQSLRMAVLHGVLENRSIEKLSLCAFKGTEESVALVARIIKENPVIRTLAIISTDQQPLGLHSLYDCWVTPLIQNDVLEEVTLRLSILHPTKWSDYFRSLSTKQNLKMVRIFPDSRYPHFQWFCSELKRSGSEKKVDVLHTEEIGEDTETLHCKAIRTAYLSRVQSEDRMLAILRQLPNCQHLEFLSVNIESDHMRLSIALAQYLRSTTTLRALDLRVKCVVQEEAPGRNPWWNLILEAISRSKGVKQLDLRMSGMSVQDSQDLATSVKRSTRIRELTFVNTPKANNTAFFRRFSEGIQDNYTLATVEFAGGLDEDAVSHWLAVKEITWRNFGLVKRAARIKEASHFDRYVTGAVERVARYPALMDEVARTAKLDQAELAVLVRDRLMVIRSMDDFMRFVGVVKERVVCHPAEDGRMRLEDLNEDCWSHVRRYLVTDDVKHDAIQVDSL
ncbi:hypothetical protein MTO96_031440 [Rhipicephalus appendiculatus]